MNPEITYDILVLYDPKKSNDYFKIMTIYSVSNKLLIKDHIKIV